MSMNFFNHFRFTTNTERSQGSVAAILDAFAIIRGIFSSAN